MRHKNVAADEDLQNELELDTIAQDLTQIEIVLFPFSHRKVT
jgi:hypothetical protein